MEVFLRLFPGVFSTTLRAVSPGQRFRAHARVEVGEREEEFPVVNGRAGEETGGEAVFAQGLRGVTSVVSDDRGRGEGVVKARSPGGGHSPVPAILPSGRR